MQNYRARHDEYLLDLDQVAGCYKPSNVSSDFPLGSLVLIINFTTKLMYGF